MRRCPVRHDTEVDRPARLTGSASLTVGHGNNEHGVLRKGNKQELNSTKEENDESGYSAKLGGLSATGHCGSWSGLRC